MHRAIYPYRFSVVDTAFNRQEFRNQMKEVVDLYTRFLIATFGFVGPSFTLLISLFYGALARSRQKHELQLRNLKKAVIASIASGNNLGENLKSGRTLFLSKTKSIKRELNLLNPKRQARHLFSSIFIAIFLIGFYDLQLSGLFFLHHQILISSSLLLSCLSFLYSLMVLWQIFSVVVIIKSEEKETNSTYSTGVDSKPD